MIRSESRPSLTCISEVHVIIRGDLYSMQCKIIPSETTGGFRYISILAQTRIALPCL